MEFENQKYATAFFRAVDGRSLVIGQPHDGLGRASAAHQRSSRLLKVDGGTAATMGPSVTMKKAILEHTRRTGDSSGNDNSPVKKQGTLMGVYLPVATSMWGVLIFIRFGVIAGYTGWVMAISFCFLSAFVQTLTTLSLCTVLSNSRNYKGGSFGILKRNLGGELAGVVCLLYYLGMTCLASIELLGSVQALAYLVGLGTGQESMSGNAYWDQVLIGGPILLVLALIRAFNIKFVHGFTALILAAVLASFFFGFLGLLFSAGDWRGTQGETPGVTGLNIQTFMDNAFPSWGLPPYTEEELADYFRTTPQAVESSRIKNPAAALSILFPTFLGIFQGANKANDLATPNTSIIRGTLSALSTSLTIYLLLFLLLSAAVHRDVLKSETLIFANLSWPSEFIGLIGTVLVGLGACVSLLEIGPTILHAVADDGLYSFLKTVKLHETRKGQPVYAVAVSFTINFLLLFVSTAFFEALASVVTMFFLQAYAQMHLALLLNEVQRHASWRPVFRFYHWSSALTGFSITVILMLLINWVMALITISIAAVLMLMVKIIEEPRRKGVGTRALGQGRALEFLLTDEMISHREDAIAEESGEPVQGDQDSFWEPQILCLLEDPQDSNRERHHLKLIHFTEQLSSRGFLPRLAIVSSLVQASRFRQSSADARRRVERRLFKLCNSVNLRAFPQAVICPASSTLTDSYLLMMQSAGLGCLRPNVVLVSWQNSNLLEIIMQARLTEKVICVLKDTAPLKYRYNSRGKRNVGSVDLSNHPSQFGGFNMPSLPNIAGIGGSIFASSPTTIGKPPQRNQSVDEDASDLMLTTEMVPTVSISTSSESTSNPPSSTSDHPPLPTPTKNGKETDESVKWEFPVDENSGDFRPKENLSGVRRRNRAQNPGSEDFSNNDEFFDDDEEDDEDFDCEWIPLDTMEDLDSIYKNKWKRKRKAQLKGRVGTIDVWWIIKNGGLPVLLANILTSHRVWKRCKIRVFAVIEGEKLSDVLTTKATVEVTRMLEAMRVHAVVEVIQVSPKTQTVLRTTVVDDNEVDVQDQLPSMSDGNSHTGASSNAGTRHGHHTVQVMLEHPFDEDDDRPFRIYHSNRVPSLAEIFPVDYGPTSDQMERRKKKAQDLRDKALKLYQSLMEEHSKYAELVVLNLPHPSKGTTSKQYYQTLQRLTDGLPRVLFVHSCLDDEQLTQLINLDHTTF